MTFTKQSNTVFDYTKLINGGYSSVTRSKNVTVIYIGHVVYELVLLCEKWATSNSNVPLNTYVDLINSLVA